MLRPYSPQPCFQEEVLWPDCLNFILVLVWGWGEGERRRAHGTQYLTIKFSTSTLLFFPLLVPGMGLRSGLGSKFFAGQADPPLSISAPVFSCFPQKPAGKAGLPSSLAALSPAVNSFALQMLAE